MNPLTSLDQLQVGTYLKIEGDIPKYSYEKISVKKLIPMMKKVNSELVRDDTEILINRERNYYFSLQRYLEGRSNWVRKVFVLDDPRDEVAIAKDSKVGEVLRSVWNNLREMPCMCGDEYLDEDEDEEELNEERDCLRCVSINEINELNDDPQFKED